MYKRTIFAIHNMMLKHYSLLEKDFFLEQNKCVIVPAKLMINKLNINNSYEKPQTNFLPAISHSI